MKESITIFDKLTSRCEECGKLFTDNPDNTWMDSEIVLVRDTIERYYHKFCKKCFIKIKKQNEL